MQHLPVPNEEKERLASLHRYAVLYTPSEAAFDRLAAFAARLFDVPIALVSLIDKDRLWLKACQGVACHRLGTEVSRDSTFCAHTILSKNVLVVEDAYLDPRFADNPFVVGDLGLRFYAGAPLIGADGHALGALCLIDFQPRTFRADQQASLQDLAASVVSELELRRSTSILAESEHLYRQMFEDSPQAMWVFDVETLDFLAVNDTAVAHFGYSRDEFLRLKLSDLRHPDDLETMLHFVQSEGPGTRFVGLCRNFKKNGDAVWTDIISHPISFEGHMARLVIATDVTERKNAEESLQFSLAVLNAQQEAAPDGILIVDENRHITSCNQNLRDLWNTPLELLQSGDDEKHLAYVLSLFENPDEFLQRVMHLYEHTAETSHDEVVMRDGRILDRYSGPVITPEGKSYGRIWYFRDVTERKVAEEALQRSLSVLKAQQEAALDGILVVDENRRIISYNQRLCELWHTPPEIIQSGSDEKHLAYALSLLKNPDEFLERVMHLYEHPAEHSRDEVEMRDGRTFDRYSGPIISAEGKSHGRIWYFRDVTERKAAEKALRQSEQRLSLHIQKTPLAVLEIAADLTIRAWNPAAEKTFGYTADEAIGKNIVQLIVPSEEHKHLEFIRQGLLTQTGGWRSTNHNRTKSGEIILCEWYNTPLVNDNGEVVSVASLARDVTEEQRVQQDLIRSEARKTTILETALDCIVSIDHACRILEWNPAAERTFGYSRAEALGRNFNSLIIPPARRASQQQRIEQYLMTGEGLALNRRVETTLLHRSGLEFPVEFSAAVVQVDGFPVFTSYLRDITERKQNEERLRLLESVVVHSHDGILITEAEPVGLPGPRVVYINDAFTRMTGYAPEEIVGRTPRILQGEKTDQNTLAFLRQKLEAGKPAHVELLNYKKDGSEFWVDLEIVPIADASGSHTHLVSVQRDITEQKRLEVERETLLAQTEALLAEALERADRDPLTGLLNHRAFHKRLKEEIDKAERAGETLAVLLIDLDNFKFFNDSYGHLAGDDVLKQVAQALQWAGRAQDVLARFGGDEFAVLMPGADLTTTLRQAEELHAAVALVSYQPPGYATTIPITLSIGLACSAEDGLSRTDLLEAASDSLHVAKTGGEDKNQAFSLRRDLAHTLGGFTMLDALVTAVDNKDRYTRQHSEDVLEYSVQIAQAFGMDAKTLQTVKVAALLHDVGKIGVPDAVLRKPGKLTEDEYEAIKQHPLMGAIIVGAVAGFEDTLDAVRHHHERWDGLGYPFGLRGEEIPMLARLMAVADAYSAMTTDRPYRKGMDPVQALSILEAGAGTQWDPECVSLFLQVRRPLSCVDSLAA